MDARPGHTSADKHTQMLRLPDGRAIGYAEYGDPDGLPVLALHGTPGSRFMFALTDEGARERGLRLIAPERRGYGLSDYRCVSTLSDLASDLEAVVDALGLDRFAIIGVSGGGPHAVAAAAVLGSRVRLLALISPVGPIADCGDSVRISPMHNLIFRKLARSTPACRAFFWSVRALVRRAPGVARGILLRRVTPADRSVLQRPNVVGNLQKAVGEGLRRGVDGAVQDLKLFGAPWQLSLPAVYVPAVLWQGSEDTIVPPEAAYYLARALPNCRLEVMEKAGHYWIFGRFGMVLDAVATAMRR